MGGQFFSLGERILAFRLQYGESFPITDVRAIGLEFVGSEVSLFLYRRTIRPMHQESGHVWFSSSIFVYSGQNVVKTGKVLYMVV